MYHKYSKGAIDDGIDKRCEVEVPTNVHQVNRVFQTKSGHRFHAVQMEIRPKHPMNHINRDKLRYIPISDAPFGLANEYNTPGIGEGYVIPKNSSYTSSSLPQLATRQFKPRTFKQSVAYQQKLATTSMDDEPRAFFKSLCQAKNNK